MNRFRNRTLLRRAQFGGAGLFGLFVLFSIANFFLVPTERLNSLIAKQLTEAFGHEVTVSGRPSVSFFPFLSVSFGPVNVAALKEDHRDLITIERASGRLSVTSLWEGNPSLRFIILERATILVQENEQGGTNWSLSNLFLNKQNKGKTVSDLRFPTRLRSISFANSTLSFVDRQGQKHVFSSINAELKGPPRASEFSIDGTMIWRGELTRFSAAVAEPGLILTGGTSAARLDIAARPISINFNGDLVWEDKLQAKGRLETTIPSANVLFDWLDLKGGDLFPKEVIELSGIGTFSKDEWDFRPITLGLGEGLADGRLNVLFKNGTVGLTGTLGFDQLILDSIGPIDGSNNTLLGSLLARSRSQATIDLRLSAENGQIAGQRIRDMAVGLNLRDHNLVINIGAAQLEGQDNLITGGLRGELSISTEQSKQVLQTSLTLTDTNFASLAKPFAMVLPLEGGLSLSLQMKTQGRTPQEMANALSADISAKLNAGLLRAVALEKLIDPNAVADDTINGGRQNTSYRSGEFSAVIKPDGNMKVHQFRLTTETHQFQSNGIIDIIGHRVSLLGLATPRGQNVETENNGASVPFSFGGTLEKLQISSVNGKAL